MAKKILIFLLLPIIASAEAAYESTEKKIKVMQAQITQIKSKIVQKQQQHGQVKLARDKKIKELTQTQHEHKNLMAKVQVLQQQIHILQNNLETCKQNILSYKKSIYEHLNLHVKLAEEPYWQVLFGAQNPFDYYQRMDLYKYIYQSEQKKLTGLQKSQINLEIHHRTMQSKIKDLAYLEHLLNQKELKFTHEKLAHDLKLKELSQSIEQQTHQLHAIEENQTRLKKLIQGLLKENTLQSKRPFTVMKQRLNYPVHTHPTISSKIQNGLMFRAQPNTPVYAVSPGRVVFADWLNGYGYLVIIDHGWGFMTLYGNNDSIRTHKGQNVRQGEEIALVGKSGAFHQTGAYFEIRQKAKVISAQTWFQKRRA